MALDKRGNEEVGVIVIAPDTSPRGDAVPSDPAGSYDFGLGAGFYVDATRPPWSQNYRMASYVERELPGLISFELPADVARQSIMGHSMGGHGALTIALRNQGRYASVSAPGLPYQTMRASTFGVSPTALELD
jgi:S-formylglutathione hydrolase